MPKSQNSRMVVNYLAAIAEGRWATVEHLESQLSTYGHFGRRVTSEKRSKASATLYDVRAQAEGNAKAQKMIDAIAENCRKR